ncbi:rhamnulokinase [Sporosarcina beigongshangi]|uniref:rhamnulokinase n=1 Tax=Sporosarcina beigongshangi TaxID=2782538 RepID=UPI00193AA905|nr:rhamnulokinase [Sporosarcina beigongshangi]
MVHIAVDIGASSGRLVIGKLKQGKLEITEIHRFENGFSAKDGTLYWDIDYLLNEILYGIQLAKQAGHRVASVGIDTWAVDYVLLNKKGKRMKEVVSYRDHRTAETIDKVTGQIAKDRIYEKTGIQFLPFNTIYQLYEEDEEVIKGTNQLLMVPDYLNYRLTGKVVMEVTNASTTQLLNVETRQFDQNLLEVIGFREDQFGELIEPGQPLGSLKKEWFPAFDLPDCKVYVIASHDTASAVVGTPGTGDNWAYLSSGTWSLLGVETDSPVVTRAALQENYTNEWGVFKTYRLLKNIMGMWIIQEVRRHSPEKLSYEELVMEASKVAPFQQYIDFNEERFLNPKNMIEEIQTYCEETNQTIPTSIGELAACVYNNLAIIYTIAIEELEKMTEKAIRHLYVVGGGAKNKHLNQLTANLSKITVFAGSAESTAIGNVMMQMITAGKIKDLEEGRKIIRSSFPLEELIPESMDSGSIIEEFRKIISKGGCTDDSKSIDYESL